ncbi:MULTISPECIES: hypothetical protein [Mesorhizobium]|uniref:hypothetical protein n=1 Tax=Mesorhizobium TaxID=68287 RepID=UPI001010FD6B|nr:MULTISPECIES: hypothetical protein [Mesorhizobium]
MALSAAVPALGIPDVRQLESARYQVFYDNNSFGLRSKDRIWSVDRRSFSKASPLRVSFDGKIYRLEIRALGFHRTPIRGHFIAEIDTRGLGDWRMRCELGPFASTEQHDVSEWLSSKGIPAAPLESCREVLNAHGISVETDAGVYIDSRLTVSFAGNVSANFWGVTFKAERLIVSAQSQSTENDKVAPLRLLDAVPNKPTCLLPIDTAVQVACLPVSEVLLQWHEDGSSSIITHPKLTTALAQLSFFGKDAARQRQAHLKLANASYFRCCSQGEILTGLLGSFPADAGFALDNGLQLLLSGSGKSDPFYIEFRNGIKAAFTCRPTIRESRILSEGLDTAFRAVPGDHTLEFRLNEGSLPDETPAPDLVSLRGNLLVSDSCVPSSMQSYFQCGSRDISGSGQVGLFSTRLRRGEDLLDLGFDFYNFRIDGKGKALKLQRASVPGPALIVVHFPPQHIEEESFEEPLGCEDQPVESGLPVLIDHWISGPSRLVFALPEDQESVPLTIDGLLDWRSWRLRVGPDSRHPKQFGPPNWDQTAIEVPTSLVLQPSSDAHWKTSRQKSGDPKAILFHASLDIPPPFGEGKNAYAPTAPIRPVWTPDFVQCGTDGPQPSAKWYRSICRTLGLGFAQSEAATQADDDTPYHRSLLPLHKREIVRLSHDVSVCPTPAQTEHLLLTSLGAWAKLEGNWLDNEARHAAGLNLEHWEQIVTQGRDQRAVTFERYLAFPFGFRITFVRETVRKIDEESGKIVGVLRTKEYVQRKQETISFEKFVAQVDSSGQITRSKANKFPFRQITLQDARSPDLDNPSSSSTYTISAGVKPRHANGREFDLEKRQLFWPTRCGRPVAFSFETTDWLGNKQNFQAPLILIADILDRDADNKPFVDWLCDYYDAHKERFCAINGQNIALAASYQKRNTEVDGLAFGLAGDYNPLPPPDSDKCSPFSYGEDELSAPFYPYLTAVKVRVPSLSMAGSTGGGTGWVALVDPDQVGDEAEIFAVAAERDEIHPFTEVEEPLGKFQLNFHQESQKSGAVAAPSPNINSFSRVRGPYGLSTQQIQDKRSGVAALSANSLGTSDPATFFLGDASILGGIKLAPILGRLPSGVGTDLPALLDFNTHRGDAPDITGFVYDWSTTKLKTWPDGDGNTGLQFVPGANTSLTIRGGVRVALVEGARPEGFIDGSIDDFKLRLVFGGNGIQIPFRRARFVAPLGRKPEFDVDIDIEKIEFVGPLLQFVDQIKKWLSVLKPGGLGFDLDIRPDGVSIIAPPIDLPTIDLGAVTIAGISITNRCDLHFLGKIPISFQFAFSRKDTPFVVTVYGLGGAGHFLIEVDTNGITLIEAALEFGAFKEISFGGVAKGSVYASGGIIFSSKSVSVDSPDGSGGTYRQTVVALVIFVHVGGSVTALGFISVSVDINVALHVSKRGSETYAYGTASVSYCIKIGFLKKDFTISYSTTIAGSSSGGPSQTFVAGAPAKDSSRFGIEKINEAEFRTYWYAFGGSLEA